MTCSLLLLVCWVVIVTSRNPGASITLDETAIVKAKDYFLPKLLADIRKLVVPGEKGHDFSFDDIHIKSANVGTVDIVLKSPNVISAKADNLELAIDSTGFAIWKKIIFKIECHGHFTAAITGTNIDLSIPFEDKDGKPYVPDVGTTVHFGNVKIDHHMDHLGCKILDKIAGLFININKKLEELVEKDVPGLIQKEVKEEANKAFSALAVSIPIGPYAILDYGLTAAPAVTSVGLSLLSLGEFEDRKHPVPSKVDPAALPVPPHRDAVIELSEFVLNTASQVFTSQGVLHHTNMSIGETTKLLKLIVPKAYEDCPNCPLTLSFNITDPPEATFKTGVATVFAKDIVTVVNAVHNQTGALDPLFSLFVNASLGLTVGVKNLEGDVFVTIQFNLTRFAAWERSTKVGPLPVKALSSFIDILLAKHIIPYINSFLKGIPLPPIPNLELTKTVVTVGTNAIVVASDISFKGPITVTPGATGAGIEWIQATHNQPVPDHSVVGGHWGTGTYYVCKGNETKKHEVDPGKAGFYKALWSCCWADHVTEHCEFIPHYQVLTSKTNLTWVKGSVGEPCPNGAIVGGHYPMNGKTKDYYICRASDAKHNQTVPGKLGYYDSLWSCCWSNGGLEHCKYIPNYEVLVDKSVFETVAAMKREKTKLTLV